MNYVFDGKGGVIFAVAKIIEGKKEKFLYSEKSVESVKKRLDEQEKEYELTMLDVPDIDFGDAKLFTNTEVDLWFAQQKISQLENDTTVPNLIFELVDKGVL